MILAEKTINIMQQNLVLTNQRALFWKETETIVLSDLHLGKTAHFRKNGIALPSEIIENDLQRLSDLIIHFQSKRMIVVGDFVHAGKNSEFNLFAEWKSKFSDLKIILVKGNHDRIAKEKLFDIGVTEVCEIYEEEYFIFSHEQLYSTKRFVISGHLHPGIRMKTPVGRFVKFPCYIVSNTQLILPAFSSFTGLDTKNHPENSHYIFFTKEDIYTI
ncbi:ligase-associated DNA damage response endonuclease PdeM [Empedobacter tilapiae]|uniref:Ligase-associated DNA damage response endonuclease PdeM n=1 Tax=Empedobacter tilapiae TaxID=2491114 RepID=A0A4Z1B803_9FLAO|nr:ligase-associated DNA damage response endonuclease PdeM [Empedobacter tilapiae]TGN24384.1 ligase-associated DNA damage response endonuclease PdeM [Empedobacter tilapiae]